MRGSTLLLHATTFSSSLRETILLVTWSHSLSSPAPKRPSPVVCYRSRTLTGSLQPLAGYSSSSLLAISAIVNVLRTNFISFACF